MRFRGITTKGYLHLVSKVACSHHKWVGAASFDDLAAATAAYLKLDEHIYVGYRWPTTLQSAHQMNMLASKAIATGDDITYKAVADELSCLIYKRHLRPGFRIIGDVKYQLEITKKPIQCGCGAMMVTKIWMDKKHEFCDTCVQAIPIRSEA